MKKRIFAGILVAVMCIAAAGCTGKKEASTVDSGKITYWAAMPTYLANSGMTFNDLPMYIEYNKRTGIEVEFVHPPVAQDTEKFNLMLASGNLPDIVEFGWAKGYPGGVTKAVMDGVVVPLDDFIEKSSPNLFKILSENDAIRRDATTRDGKYFGYPKINVDGSVTAASGGFFFRKDMLDKVGMDVPTNIEEWDKVLRAFKNELGVERPLAFRGAFLTSENGNFNSAFEVGSGYYLKDGKIAYGPLEPGYKDFIQTLATWYKDGLLDSEFAVLTADAVSSQIQSGKSGVFYGYLGNDAGKIMQVAEDQNLGFTLIGAPYPKENPDSTDSYIGNVQRVGGPYACITKNCKEPEKAAQWLDYCYSKEGSILYLYGIEGESYNMVDGVPTFTDVITNNPDGLSTFEARARYCRGYTSYIGASFAFGDPEQREQIKLNRLKSLYPYQEQIDAYYRFNENSENRYKTQLPVLEYETDVAEEVANIKFELDTYVSENLVRFISGDRPMKEWDSFVKELKSLKIDTLLGHMQKAYTQYSNK